MTTRKGHDLSAIDAAFGSLEAALEPAPHPDQMTCNSYSPECMGLRYYVAELKNALKGVFGSL